MTNRFEHHGPPPEEHALYVALADKSAAGRQAAGFLGGAARELGGLGITVGVFRIRPKDLRNRRVREALRRRGIDRLPAVLAAGHPLVGLAAIRDYYGARLAPGPGGPRPRGARAGPAPRRGGLPAGLHRGLAGGLQLLDRGAEPAGPGGGAGGAWHEEDPSLPFEGAAYGADRDDGSPEADLDDYFRQEMMVGGRLGDNDGDSGFGAA